jgi:hypothetical protein
MFDSLFHLPLLQAGFIVIGILCGAALAGLMVVRKWVLPRLRIRVEDGEFSGTMVQAIMVFYGLAVALIAVSVWETYSEVSSVVAHESTRLGALYRDVSAYPEPTRSALQKELRDYTHYLIYEAWPLHRQGEHPTRGVEWMNRFQATLVAFDPVTEGQKLMHAETLRGYNIMIDARRMRLEAMLTRLPGLLWGVVVFGAAISLVASFFFNVEDGRLHATMVTLLALFIGLVILMILAFDRPFHGELGIGPEPYQMALDELMGPET